MRAVSKKKTQKNRNFKKICIQEIHVFRSIQDSRIG